MLPEKYQWLQEVSPPRIIQEALELYGTLEKIGAGSNPVILEWAKECELAYASDDIPWCGLFAAVVTKRAGWNVVASPLWAKNWNKFGKKADKPSLGDVLVFTRAGGGGHVGFYVAEDADYFHVLGGNQGDAVSIVRLKKDRLLGVRRPAWKKMQPASVKPYFVDASGEVSTNEH